MTATDDQNTSTSSEGTLPYDSDQDDNISCEDGGNSYIDDQQNNDKNDDSHSTQDDESDDALSDDLAKDQDVKNQSDNDRSNANLIKLANDSQIILLDSPKSDYVEELEKKEAELEKKIDKLDECSIKLEVIAAKHNYNKLKFEIDQEYIYYQDKVKIFDKQVEKLKKEIQKMKDDGPPFQDNVIDIFHTTGNIYNALAAPITSMIGLATAYFILKINAAAAGTVAGAAAGAAANAVAGIVTTIAPYVILPFLGIAVCYATYQYGPMYIKYMSSIQIYVPSTKSENSENTDIKNNVK